MKYLIVVIFLLLPVSVAQADMFYNVDFEDPPHILGQVPTTGTGIDRPYQTQLTVIDSGISGFSGQAGRFTDVGSNAYTWFLLGSSVTSGIHSISWDAAMLSLDSSDGLQVAMTIGGGDGTGIDLSTRFLTGGNIVVSDPFDSVGEEVIDTWSVGEVFQFQALLDLNNDTYDYFLNGSQVIDGQSLETDASISEVMFQRPFVTSEFTLDNFRWEYTPIPEPTTLTLLGLGGLGLGLGKLKKHPEK